MYIFYDIVFLFLSLLYLPYLIYRRKYHRDFIQRLGFFPKNFFEKIKDKKVIWMHAVSVGEVNASISLWKSLRRDYPLYRIVFSTTTQTGNNLAKKFSSGEEVVIYFPLDFSFVIRKFLRIIKPSLVIILETEIWPNFVLQCFKQRIPVILVNARISDKSYWRYRLVRLFLRTILKRIDLILAQSEKESERFVNLGGNKEKVLVTGNMKFDNVDYAEIKTMDYSDKLKRLLHMGENEKLLVAGSTHRGEEGMILSAYKELFRQFPNLRLLIAPRHPERTPEIEKLVSKNNFIPLRISLLNYQLPITNHQLPVFILDTIGQLRDFYALADIVFVGGSLVKKGGHNIIEPAIFSKPIISGKYFFNFSDMFRIFLENKAILVCKKRIDFKKYLWFLLKNPEERKKIGINAKEVILKQRGASEINLRLISKYLER